MNNTTPVLKSSGKRTPLWSSMSLRAKLILANMLVITLSIVGTAYYVYARSNQANAFLANQLDENVLQQAQDNLNNTSASHATELNNFFILMRRDITTIGATASNMLSQEETLGNGTFWNAYEALTRLPNRSWDNSNNELSSVFIPAKNNLTPELVSEINTIKKLDLSAPSLLKQNPDTVAIYFGGRFGETVYYPNIDLATIVPPDFDVTQRPWYLAASPAQNPGKISVWSDPYLDAALHGLVVTTSIPVFDARGNFRGVAAMDIQLNQITDIVSGIRIGKTGYALLIDRDKRLIALPDTGYSDLGITSTELPLGEVMEPAKLAGVPSDLFTVFEKTASGKSGQVTIPFKTGDRLVSYMPIPEVGYGIVIIVPSSELLADAIMARQQIAEETASTYSRTIFLVLIILIVALVITLLIGNGLTIPLLALTKTAEEITHGNQAAEAVVSSQDEVGVLAMAINTMTSSLRHLIQSLEQQVEERTTDVVRKTAYLQAAARIAHDAAELQDMNTLIKRTVELISGRFGFYHTGIFLLDETGGRAVLTAASSEGGQRMLARGHKLAVGIQGIVGAAAYQNHARVVLDVTSDKDYYSNPDLPLTRSEAAIPLTARGKVLGILDIQSTEVSAFKKDDVEVLQTMADQIGLAIQNARLIAESQDALKRLETATAENIHRIWRDRTRQNNRSYRYTSLGMATTSQFSDLPGGADANPNRLNVPVTLRGQHIGTIVLRRTSDDAWSETDRALALEIAGQVGLALENARLLDEAQRRAAEEQSLSEFTAHVSGSLDPETILRTVVRELHHLPNVEEVSVVIAASSTKVPPNEITEH